jgi:hypothetical protein
MCRILSAVNPFAPRILTVATAIVNRPANERKNPSRLISLSLTPKMSFGLRSLLAAYQAVTRTITATENIAKISGAPI